MARNPILSAPKHEVFFLVAFLRGEIADSRELKVHLNFMELQKQIRLSGFKSHCISVAQHGVHSTTAGGVFEQFPLKIVFAKNLGNTEFSFTELYVFCDGFSTKISLIIAWKKKNLNNTSTPSMRNPMNM